MPRAAEPILSGLGGSVLGAAGVLMFAGDDLPVPPPLAIAELALAVGLLVGAGAVVLALVLARVNRQERDLVRRAVRSRALPDVDVTVLRRALRRREERLSTWRWSWLAIGGIQLLLAGSHFVGGSAADRTPYDRLFWALDGGFWIAVVVIWTARAWWERPTVVRLLAELDERAALRADA